MKQILIISFLLIVWLGAAALTLEFSPRMLEVNQISTFSFDPYNPPEQPLLTTVTITNDNVQQFVEMQVVLLWNNKTILPEGNAKFITTRMLESGEVLSITNRELISNQASTYFEVENLSFDIMDMVDKYPTLKDAVLSGFFPDGTIQMKVSLRPQGASSWQAPATFTIRVRNAGGIYLSSPGALIGQKVPIVNYLPTPFIWNSVDTGFNHDRLVVREYSPNNPPRLSTINSTGVEVYHTPAEQSGGEQSGFSQYLPLNNGYYYAWKVYTEIYNQDNIHTNKNHSSTPKLQSNWFVFRYMMDEGGEGSPEDLQIMLNMLGDEMLKNLLTMGYTPTGEVIFDGRSYSGQDALDILSSLVGKELQIEVKD